MPPLFFTFPFRDAPVSALDFSIHGARRIVIPEIYGDVVRSHVISRPCSGMKSVTAAAADDDSESQHASKKENSGVLGRRAQRVSAWPGRAATATSERRTMFWRSAAARGDGDDEDLRSLGTGGVCNNDK